MAEKLRRKFLALGRNEQVIVKAIVLVVAVMLVSVPFAYAANISNWGYGYTSGNYGYGYSGYSDDVPAAATSLSCTSGNCTWTAPTTTRGGSAISAGPFGGGSIASYAINYSTSSLSACSGGSSLTSTSAAKTLENLTSGSTYYVAVCAVDNNGNTGVAATTSFTTTSSSSSSSGGGSSAVTGVAGNVAPVSVVSPTVAPGIQAGTSNAVDFTAEAQLVLGDVKALGVTRDVAMEAIWNARAKSVLGTVNTSILNFVTYGTQSTRILGAGERLGVLNSYRAAYGRVPSTEAHWSDVIKIANGRWPSETSEKAETRAKTTFKVIYKHNADMTNAHENAAVTVMAYGLRPANRNLNSERAAIKNFRGIFGRTPSLATDWDMVRAIAYSGAKR